MLNAKERDGKIDRAKGKIKQAVGGLVHDDDLKAEGQRDEAVGNIEETVGRLGRKAGEAIEKVKDAIKR